jgi:uncharacterized LabA/DUF88 family protein
MSNLKSPKPSKSNGSANGSRSLMLATEMDLTSSMALRQHDWLSGAEPGRDRIAVFIDGSNLFYAALQLGIEIDYNKLLTYLTQGRQLLRAYFYTGVDPTNEKQKGFLLWMRRNGYRVVTKELAHLPDGSKKANLDVEIAIDMLTLSRHCHTMILLSGDGDLTYALNSVAYQGVQIEVVSLPAMTSESLVNIADRHIDLEQIKDKIAKVTESHRG